MFIFKHKSFLIFMFLFYISNVFSQNNDGGFDYSAMTIFAVGKGICDISEVDSKSEAKLNAERAAIADGYRLLGEIVEGTKVTAQTTVKNYITENDTVKTQIKAFIKGARTLETKYTEDDGQIIAEVKLEAPISGKGGFADIILPSVEQKIIDETRGNPAPPPPDVIYVVASIPKEEIKEGKTIEIDNTKFEGDQNVIKEISVNTKTVEKENINKASHTPIPEIKKETTIKPEPESTFICGDNNKQNTKIDTIITGVVFNTSGKNFNNPPLIPEVKNENGERIFDLKIAKEVGAKGLYCPYVRNKSEAPIHEKVKSTPLEIKALSCDDDIVIISNEDAQKLLSIDKNAKILAKGKVIFIIDKK